MGRGGRPESFADAVAEGHRGQGWQPQGAEAVRKNRQGIRSARKATAFPTKASFDEMVDSPHHNSSLITCSIREFSESFPKPSGLGLFIRPFSTAILIPRYFLIVCAQKRSCNSKRVEDHSQEHFKFQQFCRSWTKVCTTVLTREGDGYRMRIESDITSINEGSSRLIAIFFL